MRHTRFIVAALLAAATPLAAQRISSFGPELRPIAGAWFPTGDMRDDFKTAAVVGGQAAYELSDYFHIVGTVAWTAGHNKFATFSTDNTSIWQYDLGGEGNLLVEMSNDWLFKPFLGLGAGGRTYDYEARNVGSTSCAAGYGAMGVELQRSVLAFRVEGRDYLNCFESPMTGKKKTRNDAMLSFGIAYHVR